MASVQLEVVRLRGDAGYPTPCDMRGVGDRGLDRILGMQNTIRPIDVVVGEANDGHAELVEASLRETGVVNNFYRGRTCAEVYELVCDLWGSGKTLTDVASLVLLDCRLPQVGGIGALTALKRDRRYSWIPIIMMTTSYGCQHAEQCRHLECEAYLTKWTVFLGLPAFVGRLRFLAGRATRIASLRLTTGRSYGRDGGNT